MFRVFPFLQRSDPGKKAGSINIATGRVSTLAA
jgi:hypothetical protein